MITILAGDNQVASRKKLIELINEAKEKNIDIDRLEAAGLTRAMLEEKLIRQDLFGSKHLIIIEGLHSLPRSKQKNDLIGLVSQSQMELILWEKRTLTPTMLKKFPQSRVFKFKLSNRLFSWLDTICGNHKPAPQLKAFHQALDKEDEYLCFAMLIRQIRMLIQAKEGKVKGAPWMVSKLKKQAQTFSLEQLLQLHSRLLEIDYRHKTSSSNLNLVQELDLLMMSL